jgi:hypothetical protein
MRFASLCCVQHARHRSRSVGNIGDGLRHGVHRAPGWPKACFRARTSATGALAWRRVPKSAPQSPGKPSAASYLSCVPTGRERLGPSGGTAIIAFAGPAPQRQARDPETKFDDRSAPGMALGRAVAPQDRSGSAGVEVQKTVGAMNYAMWESAAGRQHVLHESPASTGAVPDRHRRTG